MKRRLDLAAALIHNPEVLFLDEPTTGLDPVSRATVWDEVRRLNVELGMTIFLTTQYLEEADELADRVGIIDQGRIVAEGTPDDLKRSLGSDVIVAEVDGDAEAACTAVRRRSRGVDQVDEHGERAHDRRPPTAPPRLSPVAVALDGVRRHRPQPHPAHADARRRVPRTDRRPHPAGRRLGEEEAQ